MSQQTYINIGESCTAFSETKPLDLQNNVFLINTSTRTILRNSDYTEVGPDSISGNVAIFSDYEFKTWFDESLVRSSANRSFWRYLTPSDAITKPSNDLSKTLSTSSSWPTTLISSDMIQVNHPATSSTTKTYKMVIETNTDLQSIISGLIYAQSGNFYLKKTGSTNTFLHYDGINYTEKNLSIEIFDTSKLKTYSFTKELVNVPSKRYVLRILNQPELIVQNNYKIFFNGTTYDIETTQPSYGGVSNFPEMVTLLKSVTGKYLYWDGTLPAGTPNFTLKNYWDSGLSFDNIKTGLQFYFMDLTKNINAPAVPIGPISVDYYRWMVRKNPNIDANSQNNTSNIIVNGTTFILNENSNPTNNEGWVLEGTESPYHLVYVKLNQTTGSFDTIGYMNIMSNTDNVTFVPLNNNILPSHSKSWFCSKCSVKNSATGTCSTL